jgi:hypothetical protein
MTAVVLARRAVVGGAWYAALSAPSVFNASAWARHYSRRE